MRLTIRLPKDLHDRLTEMAQRDTRSLNNLMVVVLREYIETHKKK